MLLALAIAITPTPLNCTLDFSNGHVEQVIGMSDRANSADQCRALCRTYADESLLPMREAVAKLSYRCHFKDRLVADVRLK